MHLGPRLTYRLVNKGTASVWWAELSVLCTAELFYPVRSAHPSSTVSSTVLPTGPWSPCSPLLGSRSNDLHQSESDPDTQLRKVSSWVSYSTKVKIRNLKDSPDYNLPCYYHRFNKCTSIF